MTAGTIGETTLNPGNNATGIPANGGGVYVSTAGSLTLGGTALIVGNKAQSSSSGNAANGGGVYFNSSGNFNMSGEAKITNNYAISDTSTARGGGVHFGNWMTTSTGDGDLVMSDNAAISHNNAITGNATASGGGVRFNSTSDFKMNPPGTSKINENMVQASSIVQGGGICLDAGVLTMDAGEINGNKLSSSKGTFTNNFSQWEIYTG